MVIRMTPPDGGNAANQARKLDEVSPPVVQAPTTDEVDAKQEPAAEVHADGYVALPAVEHNAVKDHIVNRVQKSPELVELLKGALALAAGNKLEPEHIVIALLKKDGVTVDEKKLRDQAALHGEGTGKGMSARTQALLIHTSQRAGKEMPKLDDLRRAVGDLGEEFASVFREAMATAAAGTGPTRSADGKINFPKLALPTLGKMADDMVLQAQQGLLDPAIGRSREIEAVKTELSKRELASVVLTADRGVGKTSIANGLALQIANGDAKGFEDVRLFQLSATKLAAECARCPRGAQECLENIVGEIEKAKNGRPPTKIILFMDEIHTLPNDIAQELKVFLAKGKIRILGATTTDEYDKSIAKDPALKDRLERIEVKEPSREEAIIMLTQGKMERYKDYYGLEIETSAIEMAVDLGPRNGEKKLPRSAVDWLDTACAFVKLGLETEPRDIRALRQEIEDIRGALKPKGSIASRINDPRLTQLEPGASPGTGGGTSQGQLLDDLDPKTKASLTRRLEKLTKELIETTEAAKKEKGLVDRMLQLGEGIRDRLEKLDDQGTGVDEIRGMKAQYDEIRAQLNQLPKRYYHAVVDGPAVAAAVSAKTNIKLEDLKPNDVKIENLKKVLDKHVIGQDHAKEAIIKAVKLRRTGVVPERGPIGVFFFAGLTGTGKTELAKAVADALGYDLKTYEGNKMKERHQVAELIGSPPGYVGHEGGSRMCKDARQTGGKMVGLLDEAEKAHPVVWETLMRVFDEGKMTDNTGEEADFNNAIFICTSNLAEDVFAAYAGDGEYTDNDAVNSEFNARYEERIPQAVRGRLKQWGGPLVFNPHGKDAQKKIVDLKVQQMQKYNAQRNDRHFELSDAARNWMMTMGFDPQYGGRALTALINGTLANTLADLVATGKFKEGDYISFDVKVADQDKPLKDRVQSVATSITELGEALKNERLPKDVVRQELADGKIALVDRAKERFFLTEGDGKEIYGPFNATAVTSLQVRAMTDEEKSAYLTKKSDW